MLSPDVINVSAGAKKGNAMLEQIADLLFDADQACYSAWKQHREVPSAATRTALRQAEQLVAQAKLRAEEVLR